MMGGIVNVATPVNKRKSRGHGGQRINQPLFGWQADGDRKRVARPAAKNDDSKEPAPPEEIFEVLREIPSLERSDLLRAYSMHIRDDRLFRSLMVLPKDMWKDWLLMEIENQ